ncbi:MAG: ribosomal protein S18-alanine N-acetyltransferase [Fimbriimonadaceae bacterium]|nr:ribosomal protein S18-alanine N-acetyltransferase [Fimbriimonadaceae bacterium]
MKILRFEALQERHLPAILEIEALCNTSPWSEQSFRNELVNRESTFLVAIGDGNVVGYGGAWRVIDELHVTTVAVHPDHRRRGIAKRLMVRLLEEGRDEGLACSTLEVRAGNEAAIRMYENLGYASVGLRKRYYPDNREDAVIMWLYGLESWRAPALGPLQDDVPQAAKS